MIHTTIARTVLGAALRSVVRYGPRTVRGYNSARQVRNAVSRTNASRNRLDYAYYHPYIPEEKWWE